MAFRHRYFPRHKVADKTPFRTTIVKPVVDSNGVQTFSTVVVDDFALNGNLPNPSDYTLEKLMNANVPLQRVDVSLDNSLTEENITNFVNNNLKIDEPNED